MEEKSAINGRVIAMEDYGTLHDPTRDDDTIRIIAGDEVRRMSL